VLDAIGCITNPAGNTQAPANRQQPLPLHTEPPHPRLCALPARCPPRKFPRPPEVSPAPGSKPPRLERQTRTFGALVRHRRI